MRVLVACEFSGIVRDAFTDAGHDAMSCDLRASETAGAHYQGDVRDVLDDGWDLMIAHPPCTFLTNAGVRWLHDRPERWAAMIDGAVLFRDLWQADIPRIAIENPVMHRYAKQVIGADFSQSVQPWQFGQGEVKRVCLWLKGLPHLVPTDIVEGREARVHRMPPGFAKAECRGDAGVTTTAAATGSTPSTMPAISTFKTKGKAR
ncbi:hypothetical protein [Parvularcula sp. LCG005]|uniref:hypothetical protein n=1 Tax=Parvularcula sp. LCG005 TaxID=3078805 RepID=UPI0029424328|nr:hypothetical protein [Parvularcula sp. LCG005]WOI54278.1 hypothetical protein RUI03_04580 [Parvularcula sp. LCG005]